MSCFAADSFCIGALGGGMRICCSSFSMDASTFLCGICECAMCAGFAGDLLFALVVIGCVFGLLVRLLELCACGDVRSLLGWGSVSGLVLM